MQQHPTITDFVTSGGTPIVNLPVNMAQVDNYVKDYTRPSSSDSEKHFSIRFEIEGRYQFWVYPDEATRNADFTVLNNSSSPDFKSTSFAINANEQIDTQIAEQSFRHIVAQIPKAPQQLTITGTIDPDNVSTGDNNLINGNFTDLCYNNRSAGSSNKALPAIDLGVETQVDLVSIWWWNATYTASNFKVQGSADGTTWQDLATNQSASVDGRQDIAVDAQVRYLRVFCVTGRNTSWVVLSEMQAYVNPQEVDQYLNHADDKVNLFLSNTGTILIKNNTNQAITVVLKH